ncbi:MAG TPA: recombinase family protein [Candidatus Xenobia bacterium]|jgi:DNA invertase Pin-like site-specific DNA recombinase
MKVVGYVRVSTEEQSTKGVSLQAQAEKLRAYASLYDLELVAIVEDAGQSAKSLNRVGIQRALEMLRNGEAEGLLVAKLDRLTRSIADMCHLVAEFFGDRSKRPVTLLSVSDQLDTRSAAGRLVINILMAVAEWEREAIGERTRTALQYKKAMGVLLGAPALGSSDGEAATVARIVELRAEGKTLQAIVDVLNAEGRVTKRGGKWATTTLTKILRRVA